MMVPQNWALYLNIYNFITKNRFHSEKSANNIVEKSYCKLSFLTALIKKVHQYAFEVALYELLTFSLPVPLWTSL